MKRIILAVALGLAVATIAHAVGTVTNDYSETRSVKVVGWYFTTTANTNVASATSKAISGQALRALVVTPAGCTNASNITLTDSYGSSMIVGTVFTNAVSANVAFTEAFDGPITMTVTSTLSGPAWSGKLLIWYR